MLPGGRLESTPFNPLVTEWKWRCTATTSLVEVVGQSVTSSTSNHQPANLVMAQVRVFFVPTSAAVHVTRGMIEEGHAYCGPFAYEILYACIQQYADSSTILLGWL
jgi:hypothetical protein